MKTFTCLLVCGFFLASVSSFAADEVAIKVQKIKGNRAVVIVKKGQTLEEGKVYSATEGSKIRVAEGEMSSSTSRKNSLGFDLAIDLATVTVGSSSAKQESIETNLTYGWNTGTIEYGPIFVYSFTKTELIDTRTISLGGFLDFNFTPNTGVETSIFGLRGALLIGQQDSSTFSKAANTTGINISFFFKYFGLESNLAMISQLGYKLQTAKADSTEVKTSGIFATIGIETYF